MHKIANIYTFNTPQLRVTVDALEEADLDLSFDDDGSVRAELESGRFMAFIAHARCVHKASGVEAEDYLGGCIYESLDHFRQPQKSSYFHDMVRSVVRECRSEIAKTRELLNTLSLKAK